MTIKLEAGKYYKRRDGEKVYCVGVSPYAGVMPYVASDKHGQLWNYTESGAFYNEQCEDDYDIIAEWVDEPAPKQKLNISEWWVGVDRDGLSCDYIHTSAYLRFKDNLIENRYEYILQVKDWIAVQQGLKDIEDFKV